MLYIKQANASQTDVVQQIAYATWPAAYNTILSALQIEYMLRLIYSTEALQKQFSDTEFYIAYDDEAPVGFIAFNLFQPAIYKIQKLYVLPDIQSKGIGRMLMEFALQLLKKRGAAAMLLNVNRRNKARLFYEKMGFIIDEEVNIDIGNGFFMNDYVMKLDMSNIY